MQTIYIDISNKSVLPIVYAKQGDVGRKFRVVFTDSGVRYNIPENAAFSVWYDGESGEGNYTKIGSRNAVVVDGNQAVVELIEQMVSNNGCGNICLILSSKNGNQIGIWNIPYCVEQTPGINSTEAKNYYTAFSEAAAMASDAIKYIDNQFKGKAGLIYPLATNDIPAGFLLCDGSAYSRTEYAELFEAIGTTYGSGDGTTTFNVPNLSTRVLVGTGDGYDLGATGGEETHTLTTEEMPEHRHYGVEAIRKSDEYFPGQRLTGVSKNEELVFKANYATVHINNGPETDNSPVYDFITDKSGSGSPYNNMPPYTVVNYIISTGKEIEFVVGGGVIGDTLKLDDTLTKPGMAADAKAVGDAIVANRDVYNVNVEGTTVNDTFYNVSQAFFSGKVVTLTDNSEGENTCCYICTCCESTTSGQDVLWFSCIKADATKSDGGVVMVRGLWRTTGDGCLLMPDEIYPLGGNAVDLTDYVKNTDYATTDKAGIIKANSGNGLYIGTGGSLSVVAATVSDIGGKYNNTRPITSKNLDYAIKKGLADNKEEWTEEEKASARDVLGVTEQIGDVETALDGIIAIQNELIGGDGV